MIGLIAHSEKPHARSAVEAMIQALEARKVPFLLEKKSAALVGQESNHDAKSIGKHCSLIVAMGGDGTILRIVHRLKGELVPILGVNIGSLGFLTCAGVDEISRVVESIVAQDYILSPRYLLQADLTDAAGSTTAMIGLNDVVISRGERSQLVKIKVCIDGSPFTGYNADGLIIATPTGSTAYSLAAGGPILMPDSGVFVVTPICPHVLTNRSTVVSDRSIIEARLDAQEQQVFVTVDGQSRHAMRLGDTLRISRSDLLLPLVMLPEKLFPEVLRHKLKWTGSNV